MNISGLIELEEKIAKLETQLHAAGDRRDWQACDKIDEQLERLREERKRLTAPRIADAHPSLKLHAGY